MGKIPAELREIIAWNIRECRYKRFPGQGGSKQCAEAFDVPAQQWSHWETGKRTPDEMNLARIAQFFNKTVEYMRRDNRKPSPTDAFDSSKTPFENDEATQGIPGSPESLYWLLRHFLHHLMTEGITVRMEQSPSDSHREKQSGQRPE